MAIGSLAIDRVKLRRVRIGELHVDHLVVGALEVRSGGDESKQSAGPYPAA